MEQKSTLPAATHDQLMSTTLLTCIIIIVMIAMIIMCLTLICGFNNYAHMLHITILSYGGTFIRNVFYLQSIYATVKAASENSYLDGEGVQLSIKSLTLLSIFFHDAIYDAPTS